MKSRKIKPAVVGSFHARRAIAAIGLALAGGCSWFLPHPQKLSNIIGDADTPQDGRCSLAVAQDRKSLFGHVAADGVPKPLTIHASIAAAREIRNGESIFFTASTRDVDLIPQPVLWRIESVEVQGNAIAEDVVLMDRTIVELHAIDGSGYLQLQTTVASVAAPRAEASRFILYKADVPDPTRPTTCDAQIRDDDFVFMRALAPSAWVSVATTGVLEMHIALPGSKPAPVGSNRNPDCAREEERCHTDPHGGLVCVWAPVCGE